MNIYAQQSRHSNVHIVIVHIIHYRAYKDTLRKCMPTRLHRVRVNDVMVMYLNNWCHLFERCHLLVYSFTHFYVPLLIRTNSCSGILETNPHTDSLRICLESTNDDGDTTDQMQCTSPSSRHGQTALSVSQAEKFVELQFDSKFYRLNIMEPFEINVFSDERVPTSKRMTAVFAKYEQVSALLFDSFLLFRIVDRRPKL